MKLYLMRLATQPANDNAESPLSIIIALFEFVITHCAYRSEQHQRHGFGLKIIVIYTLISISVKDYL